MDFIFIEALRVKSRVGIYPRERVAEQTLELNLTFGVPDAAAEHDDIADTIDYAQVIARIREELAVQQFNLIETLGEFIVKLLFDEFGAPLQEADGAAPLSRCRGPADGADRIAIGCRQHDFARARRQRIGRSSG